MRPETAAALYDMNRASARIAEATSGRSFQDLESNWLLQSAVERQFEILGEALARIRDLEPSMYDRIPNAAKIVGLRNIIIHGYDIVDSAILWAIVEDHLAGLLHLLDELIEEARLEGH
jgi:uncharacterized protein with HEPN domain